MRSGPDFALVDETSVRGLANTFEEPRWLLEDRMEALARLESLPVEPNQLFTSYVDLRQVRFPEMTPYRETGQAPELDERLPEGTSAFLHVREDAVVGRAISEEARRGGLVVDTFANVLRSQPELLRPLLEGGTTLPMDDKFAQFSRAGMAIGVLVHLPAGVTLVEPIVLRWSMGASGTALLSRTLVALGEGAHASILEECVASTLATGKQSLWTGTMEVVLKGGASLDVASEQDLGPETVSFMNRHATLHEAAQLRWALASVGGALIKSRIDNLLVGRGSGVSQAEIGFGGGSQLFDLTSYTRHLAADTTGDLLSKGVFQDRARGYFKGLIDIDRAATGTDSFLGEFAMLLAKKARSVAIPSLEIDQPDVRRASHASSVAPIDEAQIFYLMSRGLPREVARKFIVLGFLEPVVARIPLPAAQERLRGLLERKWQPA